MFGNPHDYDISILHHAFINIVDVVPPYLFWTFIYKNTNTDM